MKNIILLLTILFSISVYSQEFKVEKEQLDAIKELYKWNNEKFLVVNFTQPKYNCHYNNYQHLDNKKKWLDDNVYKNVDMTNCKSIYVFSDKQAAKKIIDNVIYFEDYYNYFLNNFFNIKERCYGLLIINQDGSYNNLVGEYSKKDVEIMLEALK
jgi:hypothetical protein